MGYSLDLSRISLGEYKKLLAKQNLLPGRRLLLEGIDYNFQALAAQQIETLAQLKQRYSSPQKLAALSAATGIPETYLTILKREIGSFEQKPVPLTAFPGMDAKLISALSDEGIVNSKDCFERGAAVSEELRCLCDLVRINGVGAVAAKTFYEAGYRSVSDVAAATAAEMLRRVSAVNAEKGYYRATLGEKDMQFCIDFAILLLRYARA